MKVQKGLKRRVTISFRAENRETGEDKLVGVSEGLDRRDGHRVADPGAARSKAFLCGRSRARTSGSNPAGGMNVCRECCVFTDRGLCDELITRPEEPYRLWCVSA